MKATQTLKILIGLREVAGFCTRLQKGFEEIGVTAHFLDLGGNHLNYSSGKNPAWMNFFAAISGKLGVKFSGTYVSRALWLLIFQNLISLPALFISIFRYDVFIFCSNSTFFFFLELPLLRLLGKKVIYVFLGTDSRPIYLNGYLMNDSSKPGLRIWICRFQKIVVRIIERLADVCINHPPQAYFHERKFISMHCVGIPVNLQDTENMPVHTAANNTVSILHAPSKTGPKGSAQFSAIVENLKKKGYPIEYIEVTNVPNAEVLRLINLCDFILDEMYSDTPMAVFASEAAAAGKPAVVGGYYWEKIKGDIPKDSLPPNAFVHPEKVEEAIERFISDAESRNAAGKEAKVFVAQKWSAARVAGNYLKILNGTVPQEWYYDPHALTYLHGCGLSEERAKANIRLFIEKGGIKSLCLSDKPELEKAMREFAYAP